MRAAGGRITAGAVRWHDGSWLRRPAGERIVNALGEPLVVVQRSVLRDILTDALAPQNKALPLPLLCTLSFGAPLERIAGEDKTAFLDRARNALLALAPEEV